jgi:hypothetical protein
VEHLKLLDPSFQFKEVSTPYVSTKIADDASAGPGTENIAEPSSNNDLNSCSKSALLCLTVVVVVYRVHKVSEGAHHEWR